MQLSLSFGEIVEPTTDLWEELDEKQRQAVLKKMVPLIVRVALDGHEFVSAKSEDNDD
jgi:hypothetical protein